MTINEKRRRGAEIDDRIYTGKGLLEKQKFMRYGNIIRNTKLRIYRVAMRPVGTYPAEIMRLIRNDVEKMRRIVRRIVARGENVRGSTED